MKKHDELQLWDAIPEGSPRLDDPTPGEVADRLGIPPKRAAYLFEKWTARGLYDYGVSCTAGWKTRNAPEHLTEA